MLTIPSRRAVSVMRAAKAGSLPASASASTTAASFAERVTRARISERAATESPGFSHSLLGAWAAALAETGRR